MPPDTGVIATALCAAVATAALATTGPAVIAALPEPTDEADAAGKLPYRELAAGPHVRAGLCVAGAVSGAALGWRLGFTPLLAGWVVLAAAGVVLAYVDARTRLLPTRIIMPAYVVMIAAVLVAALTAADRQIAVRAAAGWAVMGGSYLIMWLLSPRGLGYGDVRLSGLLGLSLGAVGWAALASGLYAGFLIGGVYGVALLVTRRPDRRSFPFGPFMLLGALVGVLWGGPLADWYRSR